jgi:hypothetical protein
MADKSLAITGGKALDSRIKQIQKLHKEINACLLKGAKAAYQAGELLYQAQLDVDAYQYKEWIESIGIAPRTLNRYLGVYQAFMEKPEALEDLSTAEALHQASMAFIQKKAEGSREGHKYGLASKQFDFDLDAIFSQRPVSKAKLARYRFTSPDLRSLWLVKKGFNSPVPLMNLYVDPPEGDLRVPYESMMKAIQGAVELYYEKVEKVEPEEADDDLDD